MFAPTGSCYDCRWISGGWFIQWRVHALRPVSVDAGNDSQTQGDRIFGADGAEAEGLLVESSRAGGADAACRKFSLVPLGCDLAPVSRSARNLFTRLNLQFTIDKYSDLAYHCVCYLEQTLHRSCRGSHTPRVIPALTLGPSITCSLFVASKKVNSFGIKQIQPLFPKCGGWGIPIRSLDSRRESTKTPGAGDATTGHPGGGCPSMSRFRLTSPHPLLCVNSAPSAPPRYPSQ